MYSEKNFEIAYHTPNMAQLFPEVAELLDILERENPQVIVEIGTYCCGLVAAIAKVLPKSEFIVIDIGDLGPNNQLAKENIAAIPNLIILDHRDSHSGETIEDLKQVLGAKKIDFLFIDADHSYLGVRRDFEMYSPFVKKGGLIGLHDIKDTQAHLNNRVFVASYWQELKKKYQDRDRSEILYWDPQQYGANSCGIGLIYL